MLEIQEILKDWQTDRPIMEEKNTQDFLLQLLKSEVQEFEEDRVEDELADILIQTLNIANLMGLDAEAIVRKKVAYNSARYPAGEFQDGDYDEVRERCKQTEEMWKEVFYDKPPVPSVPNQAER